MSTTVNWSDYNWLVFEFGTYDNVERSIVVSKYYLINSSGGTRILFTDYYQSGGSSYTTFIALYKNTDNSLYVRTTGTLKSQFKVKIYAITRAH